MLNGKTVVLGVTGGIAAYKAVEVASRLRKAGADVFVVMTESATKFVTPLTFQEITNNPVVSDMWGEVKHWHVEHIALANKADYFLIAPATANCIGKLANGIADDMLTTTVMATTAPVIVAPAMNTNMYQNAATQDNLAVLAKRGYHIIPPASGMLACGVEGVGRLPEPSVIVDAVLALNARKKDLLGKRILVTAGGTHEPLDPVRFIGNRSSGKMGYAVAEAARDRGAEVILVSGPTALKRPQGLEFISVETTQDMYDAVMGAFPTVDIVVKAAAVADYRPKQCAAQKIKKNDSEFTVVLEKNPDILFNLGQAKQEGQILVGFAAETNDLIKHAKQKIEKKNLDMIVANDVTVKGAGFNVDTNIVKLIHADGTIEECQQMTKREVAEIILNKVVEMC
ncbi:MAG: bifunctional phosphopantothenoylcysteine decarboxylase/phosphopantothenate--cysteine ligase CoaBC [Selenomonadales bacterium]|nr:bifunctional phosphopantothenoylcysteine decarboxylase/phosphopantothenate--cysteine ligase CoaBC [Selenomonadales bacterium]